MADRYDRQRLLPGIGPEGQVKLRRGRVLLVGCGALGCVMADLLARAGVGLLRIVDRDVVEFSNLQRQVLFDTRDAEQRLPKARAAALRLGQINPDVMVDPHAVDLDADNVESLLGSDDQRVQLILDGTDNVLTRYLINDVAIQHSIPWVYGACVGTQGRVMTILPQKTACLRCVFPQPPDPAELATCDTAGVLGPAANVVGAIQALAALKLLVGADQGIAPQLFSMDLWPERLRTIDTLAARRDDCPCCAKHQYEFLTALAPRGAAKLCGRNMVQVRPGASFAKWTLQALADRLAAAGSVSIHQDFVRCLLDRAPESPLELTAFPDGRLLVQGTQDTHYALSIYSRYLGR